MAEEWKANLFHLNEAIRDFLCQGFRARVTRDVCVCVQFMFWISTCCSSCTARQFIVVVNKLRKQSSALFVRLP